MARKRQSALEDIIEIVAYFPWWVGAVLAIVSYFVLHGIAIAPGSVSEPASVGMSTNITGSLLTGFARVLQYLLPIFIGIGSMTSFVQKRKKKRLYGRLKEKPSIGSLMEMNWQEFELLVGKYFEEKGYTVRQLSQPGPDGGVDLVVIQDNEKYLVQCKQWKSTKVGVKVVRELLGAIATNGAVGGYVVSLGEFTNDAYEFVKGTNIELIDGNEIVETVRVDRPIGSNIPPTDSNLLAGSGSHECPRCGENMVLRTAKRGANAGKQFWGCASYPRCRGTRPSVV